MAILPKPKRIRKEDFSQEEQTLIEKIAFPINSGFDDLYNALNGNIDFTNLNRQLASVTVNTNSLNQLITNPQIRSNLKGRVAGLNIINLENLTNPIGYPTQAPFISFTVNNNIITIENITGLNPDTEYTITLEIIGR